MLTIAHDGGRLLGLAAGVFGVRCDVAHGGGGLPDRADHVANELGLTLRTIGQLANGGAGVVGCACDLLGVFADLAHGHSQCFEGLVDVVFELAQCTRTLCVYPVAQIASRHRIHHAHHVADEGVQHFDGFACVVQNVQKLTRLTLCGQTQVKVAVGHGAHALAQHVHGGGHVLLDLGDLRQDLRVKTAQALGLWATRKITRTHARDHSHGFAEHGFNLVKHIVDAPSGIHQTALLWDVDDACFQLAFGCFGQNVVDAFELGVFMPAHFDARDQQQGHHSQQTHQAIAVGRLPQRDCTSHQAQSTRETQQDQRAGLKVLGGRG